MKVIVKGFITAYLRVWVPEGESKYTFDWWRKEQDPYLDQDYVRLCDYEIEIEAQENLDELIHAGKLKALQEKRKVILADNEQRINEIDRQISELMAIENKA